jgi:hypothetical protein
MLWFIMKEMYYFSVHPELVEGYKMAAATLRQAQGERCASYFL